MAKPRRVDIALNIPLAQCSPLVVLAYSALFFQILLGISSSSSAKASLVLLQWLEANGTTRAFLRCPLTHPDQVIDKLNHPQFSNAPFPQPRVGFVDTKINQIHPGRGHRTERRVAEAV